MNITMIAGTVGRDAELRNTQSGDAVLSFPIAVDNGKDRNGNKREATWFDCSVWGKRAQSLSNYITKGAKLAVTGRVGAREHNGKVYLQLSVNELSFMGGSKQNDTAQYNQEPQQQVQSGYMDDEIPF
jgi:single-strand DNA-binding protein